MKRYAIILVLSLFLAPFIGFGQVIGGSSQSSSITTPRDDVFDHIHTEFKKPVPYSPLRQADVIYSKRVWQIIDFREKINQPFYFPLKEHLNWKSFITVIMDALKSGELTAYNAEIDDEFTTPLSLTQLNSLMRGTVKQQETFDPETGVSTGYVDIYPDSVKNTEVLKLRIKEVWYFDKQRSQMQVRILGLCPVRVYVDDLTGEPKKVGLFWVYFPEARSVLARAEVFNTKNGAERRTYDDIFWKRMFSSYIYKVENVYDRKIDQYAIGMDALLESERIKNDIFNIEQEMWEY